MIKTLLVYFVKLRHTTQRNHLLGVAICPGCQLEKSKKPVMIGHKSTQGELPAEILKKQKQRIGNFIVREEFGAVFAENGHRVARMNGGTFLVVREAVP